MALTSDIGMVCPIELCDHYTNMTDPRQTNVQKLYSYDCKFWNIYCLSIEMSLTSHQNYKLLFQVTKEQL